MFGFNVRVVDQIQTTVYHNVTELHYAYDNSPRMALESDIHGTGATITISNIIEMEVRPAEEKFSNF